MLRDVWKKHGYDEAHRSGQFSAKGESSADIEGIDPKLHIECKVGYTFKTIYDWAGQSESDAKAGQTWVVNCKMDRKQWLAVLDLDDFIEIWKDASAYREEKQSDFRCENCRHGIRYTPENSFEDKWKCDILYCQVPQDFWCGVYERRKDG